MRRDGLVHRERRDQIRAMPLGLGRFARRGWGNDVPGTRGPKVRMLAGLGGRIRLFVSPQPPSEGAHVRTCHPGPTL